MDLNFRVQSKTESVSTETGQSQYSIYLALIGRGYNESMRIFVGPEEYDTILVGNEYALSID